MFRNELSQKLSAIFGFQKTTFDAPSINSGTGTFEQDVLFIEISEYHSRMTEGRTYARILGSFVVFSQMDKTPFGFFNKKIQQASFYSTKDFFFYDIDQNPINSPAKIQNITERRVKFVYLYSAQYDPAHGSLTSVEGI